MGCLRPRCSCLTFRSLLNEAWFVMQVTLKQSKKRIFEEMQKKRDRSAIESGIIDSTRNPFSVQISTIYHNFNSCSWAFLFLGPVLPHYGLQFYFVAVFLFTGICSNGRGKWRPHRDKLYHLLCGRKGALGEVMLHLCVDFPTVSKEEQPIRSPVSLMFVRLVPHKLRGNTQTPYLSNHAN